MKRAALFALPSALAGGQAITVPGARFPMDGKSSHCTGVGFFNALYNSGFGRDAAERGA